MEDGGMNSFYVGLCTVLLIITALYNLYIYRRYRAQQTALQKCQLLSNRLSTIGEMAACVAHEIRNPLTTIHGYLQVFSGKAEFTVYQEQLALLLNELNRTDLLIKEYLSLSKEKTAELKPTQLNNVIRTLFPLIQAHANSASKDIRLELGDIPQMNLDEKEVRQLILNLVRNGLEAIESGQTVCITTSFDSKNQEILLTIQDQGKGIPQHVLKHLGKPFITTKENGTGLGLAVSYRIAAHHKARIDVNTGSEGTIFLIRFPAVS
jgi:signal transduction histidine kinase